MRAAAALVVLVLGLVAGGIAPGGAAVAGRPSFAPPAAAVDPLGNFSLAGLGPENDTPAGSTLGVQYELRDPSYSGGLEGLYVHVPGPSATFNVSWGVLRVALPGATVVFDSAGWSNPTNTTFTTLLANETVFPNTGQLARDRATLTTEGMAITSPAPFGALTIEVRWHWYIQPSVGNVENGSWLPTTNGVPVEPGQYVQLSQGAGVTVAPGANYSACLTGAVGSRLYQMQEIVPSPHLLIAVQTGTAPAGTARPYCLFWHVPAWLVPQAISVELWGIPNASSPDSGLWLYQLRLVVAPATPGVSELAGIDLTYWYVGGTAAAVAVAGTSLFLGLRRRARRPGAPPVAPPESSPPSEPAKAPAELPPRS